MQDSVRPRAPLARLSDAADRIGPENVAHLTVGEDGVGQRLDNYLIKLAKGVPKSHVYRIVRSGEVRVNGGRAAVDQRLALGDRVRVPPIRVAAAPLRPRVRADMPPILYEDEHLIVVDKPAGLAAHGGSGVAFGLIEQVRAARPQQPFLELAHRLDRETSGVLLLAKTRRALVRLHDMLREGQVDKRYLTLVVGDWQNDRQHVKAPLTKYVTREGERRVAVDEADGAPSHTIFNLRDRFGAFSLLEAELKTGRTHQIRVHLAHLGYPIVGDDKYGDFDLNKRAARGDLPQAPGARLARMFLHAHATRFAHPVGGAPIDLVAPLPRECDDFLKALTRA
ncbi:MAG: RluA family pseudouridine synthase [Burkholderiaceae bacterium]|jgi:23S rRNA pseudouridine955/2504/2580 synthase|nr:RluA family pseudouridine synthase [Burkholderiaceae bacterium]